MTTLHELSAGPEELLVHADRLVTDGSPSSLRTAFVLIDSVLEGMARTYLKLTSEADPRTGAPTARRRNSGELLSLAFERAGAEGASSRLVDRLFDQLRQRLYLERSEAGPSRDAVSAYLEYAYGCLELFYRSSGTSEIDTLPLHVDLLTTSDGSGRTVVEEDVIFVAEHDLEYGSLNFEDGLSALIQLGRIDDEEAEVLRIGVRLQREDTNWYRRSRELAEWFVRVSLKVSSMVQEIVFGSRRP